MAKCNGNTNFELLPIFSWMLRGPVVLSVPNMWSKTGRSENNAFSFMSLPSSLLSARYFPAILLDMPIKIRSTNKSRRFSGNRHSGALVREKNSPSF